MLSDETAALPGVGARPGGAHYAVLDQGAHVLAWQPAGERPVLWVSSRSAFTPGVAVRGGIPVVFPWFGAGADGTRKPAHGYARTTVWERLGVAEDGDRLSVRYRLGPPDPAPARDHEPASGGADAPRPEHGGDGFPSAELTAEFSATQLAVTLTITNDAGTDVTVEAALHTYLSVGDIRQVRLDGFEGCLYRDMVPGAEAGPHTQRGEIRFTGETDRLFDHTGAAVLHDPAWDRTLTVSKQGSANTVVWNPWADKAGRMADFGDDEWPRMVCIEAANVRASAIMLAAGSSHAMSQMITVGSLA